MRLLKLYIDNFMCHDKSYIDFTQFNSALIVGKVENSDLESNGVGKTTIFKAIEYVLFNQSDFNLERIIRDDATLCQVVLDFLIGDQEYRLARSRTINGNSDLTLLQRTAVPGNDIEVYHNIINDNLYIPFIDKELYKKYWKDLSGSRAGDTERDLVKLIKINPKSFRSTVHFLQYDLTGLPTVTPEKRKTILKDALNLEIYSKIEKIVKEQSNAISKDIDKYQALLENLGDPEKELLKFSKQTLDIEEILSEKKIKLAELISEADTINIKIIELTNTHSTLESKFANFLLQEKSLQSEKSRLEISVKEYKSKKSNVAKAATELVEEIKNIKNVQSDLAKLDYSQIDILNEKINELKEKITYYNINIKDNIEKYEDLKIPLPNGNICKNCRKPMTDDERKEHQIHIIKDMEICQSKIQESKKYIVELNSEIIKHQKNINSLKLSKQQFEEINSKITTKNKEVQDKKDMFGEYSDLLNKFELELSNKKEELNTIIIELNNSSIDEAKEIQKEILTKKQKVITTTEKINILNKEINHYNNNKAIIQYTIDQKINDKTKKEEYKKILTKLEENFVIYPSVLQAFSSTGVPNLIIHNVLDDLQIEANILLSQLRPGLQLQFEIEKKIKKTGDQADTLDINYQLNGKDKYYEQLSGAQKLAITFSLRLGLSFLLQKMIGTDIKFLLLDEVDQSLDKARTDAFAEIIKFFQKDFTILVITHNDRLKDKFSHAILVEQNHNMVSNAKVVTSW